MSELELSLEATWRRVYQPDQPRGMKRVEFCIFKIDVYNSHPFLPDHYVGSHCEVELP